MFKTVGYKFLSMMRINSIVLIISAFSFIVADVSADNATMSLAGVWKSSLGECNLPGSTDENHLGDGAHRTDVTTELTRLWPFEGVVDYERTIDLPESMAGDSLEIKLERTKRKFDTRKMKKN